MVIVAIATITTHERRRRTLERMGSGTFVAALVDLLLPAACGGCGLPGTSWCAGCHGTLGAGPPPLDLGGLTVVAAGRYRGPLRTALLAYKERGRRDLAVSLAGLLVAPLARIGQAGDFGDRPVWLVPAPSRPSAARSRGGDHVLRLCRALATGPRTSGAGLRVAPALRLGRRARDSVGLDAAQRRANLAGRLRVCTGALPPPGARVLLVDDVVTTGATVAACRVALGAAGVRVGAAIVLCDATSGHPDGPSVPLRMVTRTTTQPATQQHGSMGVSRPTRWP